MDAIQALYQLSYGPQVDERVYPRHPWVERAMRDEPTDPAVRMPLRRDGGRRQVDRHPRRRERSAVRPPCPTRCVRGARSPRASSSSCVGSWWNIRSFLAPVTCRVRHRVLVGRVPPPAAGLVLIDEYCESCSRTSTSSASANPSIQSGDSFAKSPSAAGSWSGMYANERPSSSKRNPTVGPGCSTAVANRRRSDRPRLGRADRGTCTSHGTSWRSIGNSGGDMYRASRSFERKHRRRRPPDVQSRFPASRAARRTGTPRRGPCAGASAAGGSRRPHRSSDAPSSRIPVPASRTIERPVVQADLDAGRVAAVSELRRARRRERPAAPPDRRPHG